MWVMSSMICAASSWTFPRRPHILPWVGIGMEILRRLYNIARIHLSELPPDGGERSGTGSGNGSRWNDADRGKRSESDGFDSELASYYANLEIPYGSDLDTVRAAWRRLMKKYHPDLHSADPEKRELANGLSAQLTHAYRELEAALNVKRKM